MTILCYHSVEPHWTSPLAVEPQLFAEHCAWISRHRTVLPLSDAVGAVDRSGRLPRGLTSLTFDDGFEALHEYVLPVLKQYRLPATVFLVAQTLTDRGQAVDWVDTAPDYPLTTLGIDQVLDMQSAGVDFQSHSYAHLDLTSLSFDDCVKDLRDSRELLGSLLGREVTQLAYPRGLHDQGVRAAAERAGYRYAFTLPEGPEQPGPYSIPRVGLYRGNSVANLRVKAARSYLPARTGSAYQVGRRLSRAVTRLRRPS